MSFTNPHRILFAALLLLSINQASSQNVCIDSILIDGSISKYMGYKDFIKTGIKIDSITSAKPMDSYDPDSMIYIGSSTFWYDSRRGTCDARIIYFDKVKTLSLRRFILTNSTTYSDLRKMFPLDCNNTRPIKLYSQSGNYQVCSVPVSDRKGELWDMKILFIMKGDQIFRIDFWEPM